VLEAVIGAGRVVAEVAAAHGLSWWTVQACVNAAAGLLADLDVVPVRRLGIDEHRYRSVRWFRDHATSSWRRFEPWMSTFVDAETGSRSSRSTPPPRSARRSASTCRRLL
jgi:transposase